MNEPINMVLHCPACGVQHTDAAEEVPNAPIFRSAPTESHPHKMEQVGTYIAQGDWTNPPHRSHLCRPEDGGCGHIWRPADVPTNGVANIQTRGSADSPISCSASQASARYRELNTPEIADFLKGVEREALHQRERWGANFDEGKAPEDWFWLLGYLGGKALHAAKTGDSGKALHHMISSAAALLNWHAALLGTHTAMRPGIVPPADLHPKESP